MSAEADRYERWRQALREQEEARRRDWPRFCDEINRWIWGLPERGPGVADPDEECRA